MKKKIQLSIPKPCHEQWSSFSPTQQGGFCSGCQKEVIDFTGWSEDRLKAYFKNLDSPTCGRFRTDQLKLYTYSKPPGPDRGWIAIFLTGALLLLTSKQASAQLPAKSKQQTEQYQPEEKTVETEAAKLPHRTISGVVRYNEDDTPLPGVNVLLMGTDTGTITDSNGKFKLDIKHPWLSDSLIFSFIGLKTVTIPVGQPEITVVMENDTSTTLGEIIMGGIVRRPWYSPRMWWWRIKSIF